MDTLPGALNEDTDTVLLLRQPQPHPNRPRRWPASLLVGALGALAFALAALLCLLFDRRRPVDPVTPSVPRDKSRLQSPISPPILPYLSRSGLRLRPRSSYFFKEPSLPALADEANHPQYHPPTTSAIR